VRVEVRDARKRFGAIEALAGVSIDVPAGRKVALVGPNGSGKSTLSRAIMGMVAVEGRVLVDGRSPFEDRARVAFRVAYVPQTAPQLGATVGEVVRMVASVRGLDPEAIVETGRRLDLDVVAAANRPIRSLSGGMKQKLLVALAFSSGASLFVMDEPTASLDVQTREAFFRLFSERARDATLLLSSHRLEEVQHLVDEVVVLEAGHVTFDGPVGAFLDARARSVVEVFTKGGEPVPWLSERGFAEGAPGAWWRRVERVEKMALLGELAGRFSGTTVNVVVRDLEALDVPDAGPRKEA
jgi:ABC-type multidrug transport system ATPase subunit